MRKHGDHGRPVPGLPFPRHVPETRAVRRSQPCQVLLVEENPGLPRLLEIALSPLHVRLEAVPSVQAALDRLRRLPSPHVVHLNPIGGVPSPGAGQPRVLPWDALSVTLFRARTDARGRRSDHATRRTLVTQLLDAIQGIGAESPLGFGEAPVDVRDTVAA